MDDQQLEFNPQETDRDGETVKLEAELKPRLLYTPPMLYEHGRLPAKSLAFEGLYDSEGKPIPFPPLFPPPERQNRSAFDLLEVLTGVTEKPMNDQQKHEIAALDLAIHTHDVVQPPTGAAKPDLARDTLEGVTGLSNWESQAKPLIKLTATHKRILTALNAEGAEYRQKNQSAGILYVKGFNRDSGLVNNRATRPTLQFLYHAGLVSKTVITVKQYAYKITEEGKKYLP